jgi:hypothetical protein
VAQRVNSDSRARASPCFALFTKSYVVEGVDGSESSFGGGIRTINNDGEAILNQGKALRKQNSIGAM